MAHEDQPAESPRVDPTRPIYQQQPEQFGAAHRPTPDAQFRRTEPGDSIPSASRMPESGTPGTSPALRRPRWSGKKSAVVAALAIGLSSAGAIGAAAASPAGRSGGGAGQHAPGGFGRGMQGGAGADGRTGTGTQGGGAGTQIGPGGSAPPGPPSAGTGGHGTGKGTTGGTTT